MTTTTTTTTAAAEATTTTNALSSSSSSSSPLTEKKTNDETTTDDNKVRHNDKNNNNNNNNNNHNNNNNNNNNNSNKKNNKNNNNEDVLLEAYFRGQPPPTRLETQRVIQALLSPPTTDASSSTAKATRTPTKIATTVPQDMQAAAYGEGPLILSDIPQSILDLIKQQQQNHRGGTTTTRGVIVGIDEAGRGSVLGPMVYGAAYWLPPNDDDDTEPNGHNSDDSLHVFADSKQLTPEKRNFLWNRYLLGTNCGTAKDHQSQEPPSSSSSSPSSRIGFAIRILTASEISRNMLRSPTPYNLNQMSHGAAIQLIQQLLRVGIPIAHVFIDTVGDAAHYKRKLQQVFASSQDMEFTVEAKADATYPPCQAASVVAKVLRDALVQHHDHSSSSSSLCSSSSSSSVPRPQPQISSRMGSGYPSDPTCQAWIKEHSVQCPVFGFAADAAPLVRFSWKPIVHLFQPPAAEPPKKTKPTTTTRTTTTKTMGGPTTAKIRLAADEEEDNPDYKNSQEQKRQRLSLQSFLLSGQSNTTTNNTAQRYPYFVQKGLRTVSELG